jgi:hypothetical protein
MSRTVAKAFSVLHYSLPYSLFACMFFMVALVNALRKVIALQAGKSFPAGNIPLVSKDKPAAGKYFGRRFQAMVL